MPSRHVFITGPPGCGKSTLIKRVAGYLQSRELPVKGFYTAEVRDHATHKRVGFEVIDVCDESRRRPLARIDATLTGPKVGQYTVIEESVSNFALDLIRLEGEGEKIIILDEVGKMEDLCPGFHEAVKALVGSSSIVLGSVALKGATPSMRVVREQCQVVEMNRSDTFFEMLCKMLSPRLPDGGG